MRNHSATHDVQFSRRGDAFTLIELLVVIAVIGVLAALILPALTRAKSSARRITCVNNLRQLGLAAQSYWDDHNDRTFSYSYGSTNGGKRYWFGWLEDGAEGARKFDVTQGVLWPYLQGRGVELCPSLRHDSPRFKLKATGAAYGYGYNRHLAGSFGKQTVQLDSISRRGDIALFADAAQVNTFQPPASPDNPLLEEFYYIADFEPTVHFRHQGRANVVHCDGHVEAERPAPGSLDERMPGELVGRLPAALLRVP